MDGKELTMEAFNLFEEGVKPAWEDPVNAEGSDLRATLPAREASIDSAWTNMVLSLIGEIVDTSDEATGARLVARVRGARTMHRVELWCRTAKPSSALVHRFAEAVRVSPKAIQLCRHSKKA